MGCTTSSPSGGPSDNLHTSSGTSREILGVFAPYLSGEDLNSFAETCLTTVEARVIVFPRIVRGARQCGLPIIPARD